MAAPFTTRRGRSGMDRRTRAGARRPPIRNTNFRSVQGGKLAWRSYARQLPHGFMQAVNDAFGRPAHISERVRRVQHVLELFDQSEDALPTKIRRFLNRFDGDGGEA